MATGRGLATRPCCSQHSACSRPCHGLLFAEADREDLLSLLSYEGGLPEAGAETPLARSDVLAGTSLEMLQAPEEAVAAVVEPGGPGGSQGGPAGGWFYGEGLGEVDPTCEGNRDSSPEPAWAALSPAAAPPEKEQLPQGSVTVSAWPTGWQQAGVCPPGSASSWGFGRGQRGAREGFSLGLAGPCVAGVPGQDPQCQLWLLLS